MSESMVKGLAILADIKFLVRPGAQTDAAEYAKSDIGSYHIGKEGDIFSPQLKREADFALIASAIKDYERRIARAFLMSSASTRDAERVTAEEIRRDANELETAHGGLYSRMVDDWQTPFARFALADVDFKFEDKAFDVQIVTGMDTLSRSGDMDNFMWFIQDMRALNEVPEEIRAEFDVHALVQFSAGNRAVNYTKFMKTKEQSKADKLAREEREMNMLAREQSMQTAGKMAVEETKKG